MVSYTQMQRISSGLSGVCDTSMIRNNGNERKYRDILRYDAHPMAILTSAFAYLGSYYSEANPSLRGGPWFFESIKLPNT